MLDALSRQQPLSHVTMVWCYLFGNEPVLPLPLSLLSGKLAQFKLLNIGSFAR